jgi:hypothetical protein
LSHDDARIELPNRSLRRDVLDDGIVEQIVVTGDASRPLPKGFSELT